MSFIIYDLTFLVLFSLAIGIFLYVKRKNLKRDGIMYLYRTQIGMKFIEYFGKKYPKTMKVLSYIIVACGYLLMIAAVYFLVQILIMFMKPEIVKLVKVPPIMPLIPYIGEIFNATWLPPFYFTYWIVAIALVAIFHEGAHGIFAKFNKIRIKSTGFGFLGPFLAFFVEQDEKQMQKAKIFPQLTVLGAGVFANIILTVIFFLLLGGFFSVAYSPAGVVFQDYSYMVAPASILYNATLTNYSLERPLFNLTKVNIEGENYFIRDYYLGEAFENYSGDVELYLDQPAINYHLVGYITEINDAQIRSYEDLTKELANKKPGENITVIAKTATLTTAYSFELGYDYTNKTRGVMGIMPYASQSESTSLKSFISKLLGRFQDPSIHYEPKMNSDFTKFVYYLLWWIFMINFSVAIANMLPLGIFDGGRFFMLTILALTGSKKIAEKSFKVATWLLLGVVALLMVLYFFGMF